MSDEDDGNRAAAGERVQPTAANAVTDPAMPPWTTSRVARRRTGKRTSVATRMRPRS